MSELLLNKQMPTTWHTVIELEINRLTDALK